MTNSELAILSLITEKPRHGYEIEQIIQDRGLRDWTEIGFSSIYYLLRKLVQMGYASSISQPAEGRGPAKKVFRATPAGVNALRAGLREGITNPEQGGRGFLLGLSCLPLLSPAEALSALTLRRMILDQKRTSLAAHPSMHETNFPEHVRAMFSYSLALIDCEMEWLTEFINKNAFGG